MACPIRAVIRVGPIVSVAHRGRGRVRLVSQGRSRQGGRVPGALMQQECLLQAIKCVWISALRMFTFGGSLGWLLALLPTRSGDQETKKVFPHREGSMAALDQLLQGPLVGRKGVGHRPKDSQIHRITEAVIHGK